MSQYRLYIDESGDHTYHQVNTLAARYLSLTGIAVHGDVYRESFHPALETLKQAHFPHNPDEPVILHRKELTNRSGVFKVLLDPARESAFNTDVLNYLGQQNYKIFTIVIDKKAHTDRYGTAAFHPYHYCLTVLLERYRGYLNSVGGKGDVMAESRGGAEDMELKKIYNQVYTDGTQFIKPASFQEALTSRELKLKKKAANIAGLQVADLLAYPLKQDILVEEAISGVSRGTFGEKICAQVRGKQNAYSRKLIK